MSRTNFHGSKGVRAIERRLYFSLNHAEKGAAVVSRITRLTSDLMVTGSVSPPPVFRMGLEPEVPSLMRVVGW